MDRLRGAFQLVAALALLVAVVMLGIAFGYLRALVALVFGGAVLWLGTSYFKAAGEVPPEPEAEDVTASALKYVCPVCGLELRVEVATTDKPPRHCREAMVLVTEETRQPPLRGI